MKNMLRRYEGGGFEDDEPDATDAFEDKVTRHELEFPRLSDSVYQTDPGAKALTGRTPERIARETGISKDRMFPENGKILYVGDPWQRMGREFDNPNFTIIDYEFGDIAAFIKDESEFRSNATIKTERLLSRIEELKQGDILREGQLPWVEQFEQLVLTACGVSDSAREIEDYPKAAEAWSDAKKFIEEQYAKDLEDIDETKAGDPGDTIGEFDALSVFRRSAWYNCIYCERGFRDIPDWQKVILPKLKKEKVRLMRAGMRSDEAEDKANRKTKGWIEEIRLKKIPKQANVVEAIFPELPFDRASFDRFVASWSISAHTFGVLDEAGFRGYWEEISRILKDGGEAFIFPILYGSPDEHAFEDSLNKFSAASGVQWKYLDEKGQETNDILSAETLWLKIPQILEISPERPDATSSAT
jgi:SAM-dependent methyltransferase